MKLTVEFNNQGATPKTVSVLVEVAAIHYTGVFISSVMSSNLTVTVPANESEPRKRTERPMFCMKACVHGLMCVCCSYAPELYACRRQPEVPGARVQPGGAGDRRSRQPTGVGQAGDRAEAASAHNDGTHTQ